MKKYETGKRAKAIGQTAVFVLQTCRQAAMIKSGLVSSKNRCGKWPYWEGKP